MSGKAKRGRTYCRCGLINLSLFPTWFPGQIAMSEAGLYYNYFRDYDPATGRYVESDPIGLKGGINTYAYVKNRPVLSIDPLGLADCTAGKCCTKVKMWICDRPVMSWYGSMIPNHKYVCCDGPNKNCFGHRSNDLRRGDPIPSESSPTGTCREVEVCAELRQKKCNSPVSPCNGDTFSWNCRNWAEWDGESSCPN